jgi:hypothetical protein
VLLRDLNTVRHALDSPNAVAEVAAIESGINFPFAALVKPANWPRSEYAGPVASV